MPRKGALTPTQWAHKAIYPLTLPSGAEVSVRPLNLPRAIVGGRVPNPLIQAAIKAEYGSLDVTTASAEELRDFEDFRDWAIRECVVEPVITAEWVRDELPADDRPMLWEACIHGRFTNQALAPVYSLLNFLQGAAGGGPARNGDKGEEAAE